MPILPPNKAFYLYSVARTAPYALVPTGHKTICVLLVSLFYTGYTSAYQKYSPSSH